MYTRPAVLNEPLSEKKFNNSLIFKAGLLVGTLDILSAFVDYYIATGNNPLNVLPFVASGIFGKPALTGGAGMMTAGLLFHYVIAFSFTVFFFLVYNKLRLWKMHWIITGVLYGFFIWIVMNLVVVQLSGAPHAQISAMKAAKVIKSMLILICMIGLPLAFIARRSVVATHASKPD